MEAVLRHRFDMKWVYLALLLCWLLVMPITQFNIPVPPFRLTMADIVIVGISGVLLMQKSIRMHPRIAFFMVLLGIQVVFAFLSILNAPVKQGVISGMLPLIYSMLIVLSVSKMATVEMSKYMKYILFILYIAALSSILPAYQYFFTGVKNPLFFPSNWRYTYLTINANQFSSYLPLVLMMLLMLIVHLKKSLTPFFVLVILSVYPMLISGSRSGVVYIVGLLGLLAFVFLSRSGAIGKVVFASAFIALVIYAAALLPTLDLNDPVLNRSLMIFQLASGGGEVDASSETRFHQLDEGLYYFMQEPLFGLGKENFRYMYKNEFHIGYVAILFETGIFGAFSLLLILGFIAYSIWKSRTNFTFKVVAFACYFLFLVSNATHNYFRQRWTWFFLALIVALSIIPMKLPKRKQYVQTRRIQE